MIQIVKDDTLYLINDSGVVSAMADAGVYELDEKELTYEDLNRPCVIVEDWGSERYEDGFEAIYENDLIIGTDIVVDQNEEDEIQNKINERETQEDDDE